MLGGEDDSKEEQEEFFDNIDLNQLSRFQNRQTGRLSLFYKGLVPQTPSKRVSMLLRVVENASFG